MKLANKFFCGYWGDSLAFTAGLLYSLAFAPFAYSSLIFLALSLLFLLWQQQTSLKRAFWRSYLFGLAEFGLGVSWVYVSIHDFGQASILASSALTALFVCFWAILPALAGFFYTWISRFKQHYLLMPLVWLLVEYGRSQWVLNGFPWLLAGYSQLDSPLAGYIPLLGVYGVSFIAVLLATLIVIFLQANKTYRINIICLTLIVWSLGAYLQTIAWTQAIGEPLRVALIQGNITQDKKWLPEYKRYTLQLYQALTEQNWNNAEVIVWPETSIPATLSEVKASFLIPLHHAAQQHKTDLIVSLPIKNENLGEKYNAVMTLGNQIAIYKKRHLLPFGETMPWQPLSGWVLQHLAIKFGNFTEGKPNQPLLIAGGYAFITSICYEDVFGEYAIDGLNKAAYLVNVTNDGWFGQSIEPYQHLQMARMRALETGRYLLRSTNTGLTAIIAPNGKITQQAPWFETNVLNGSIAPMGGLTPYAQLGDQLIMGLITLLLCILIYVKKI